MKEIPTLDNWRVKQIPFAKRSGKIIRVPIIFGRCMSQIIRIVLIDNFDIQTGIIYTKHHCYKMGEKSPNFENPFASLEELLISFTI